MTTIEFIENAYDKAATAFGDYAVEGCVTTVETPDGRIISFVSIHCEEYRYLFGTWEDVASLWAMFVEVSAPPRTSVVEVAECRVISRNAKGTMAIVAVTWEVL